MQADAFGSLSKKIIIIGAIIMLLGVAFLNWLILNTSAITTAVLVSLVWIIAVMMIVITAYLDELSQELKGIYTEQTEEVRMMRAEMNLFRYDFNRLFSAPIKNTAAVKKKKRR